MSENAKKIFNVRYAGGEGFASPDLVNLRRDALAISVTQRMLSSFVAHARIR